MAEREGSGGGIVAEETKRTLYDSRVILFSVLLFALIYLLFSHGLQLCGSGMTYTMMPRIIERGLLFRGVRGTDIKAESIGATNQSRKRDHGDRTGQAHWAFRGNLVTWK